MPRFLPQYYLLLFAIFCSAGIAHASGELVLCNGVWTNDNCEGVVEKQVGASSELSDEEIAAVQRASKKRSLLHETRMKAIDARRNQGVDLDPEEAEAICTDSSSTVAACRTATEAFTEKLNKQVSQAIEIAKAKQEAQNEKREQQSTTNQPSHTTIVIDERPIYILDPRHPKHHGPGHSGSYSAGGAAINIKGKSKDGRLEVGVTAGGSAGSSSHRRGASNPSSYHRQAPHNRQSTGAPKSDGGGKDMSGLLDK